MPGQSDSSDPGSKSEAIATGDYATRDARDAEKYTEGQGQPGSTSHGLSFRQKTDHDDDVAERSSDYTSVSDDQMPPIQAFGYSYHGSGRIMMPNDEAATRYQALLHNLYKVCLNGRLTDSKLRIESDYVEKNKGDLSDPPRSAGAAMLRSPNTAKPSEGPSTSNASSQKPQPFRILDVGSGSGIWAVEMAEAFPEAEVTGVDLTSAQLPKDVPPNLTFEILDVTEPWGPRLYDLIHFRNPIGGGFKDWPSLIAEAWAHLKPGGIIEFSSTRPKFYDVEPEAADLPAGETPEIGSACRQFEINFGAMSVAQEMDWDPLSRVSVILTRLGADMVRESGHWLPIHNWGGDAIMKKKGEIAAEILSIGLEQWSLMLFSKCGWTEEDTRDLIKQVREEVKDPKMKSMFRLMFVTAQKRS